MKSRVILVFSVLLLIAEILPFRPLFGSFRPLWSNYSSNYNDNPSNGVLNPWWMGWGEEIAIGGKRIKNYYHDKNKNLTGIRLYTNYFGEWLYKKNDALIIYMDTLEKCKYTESDFYILNRMGITLSMMNFPEEVAPFDVIRYRGFIQCWIFRGCDLAEKGFVFKKESTPTL